jgi:hypothetical protein
MVQPNAAPRIGWSANRRRYCCRPNRFEHCSTEGSEEDLNRRQQRGLGSGFRDGHPVGPSTTLLFSNRPRRSVVSCQLSVVRCQLPGVGLFAK